MYSRISVTGRLRTALKSLAISTLVLVSSVAQAQETSYSATFKAEQGTNCGQRTGGPVARDQF